jgi:hypothetical protein
LGEILERRLELDVQITHDIDLFNNTTSPFRIAYSADYDHPCVKHANLWIFDSGFLFENFVRPYEFLPDVTTFSLKELSGAVALPFSKISGLFPVSGDQLLQVNTTIQDAKIPFDLFSAIFWAITRYEEIQWSIHSGDSQKKSSKIVDNHGRFPAHSSLLFKINCLDVPLVDHMVLLLGHALNAKPKHKFEIIPTADVDIALKFGGRSLIITLGSIIRDCIKHPYLILERARIFLGKPDPYSIYNHTLSTLGLNQNTSLSELSPKLFLLTSEERSSRNKQIRRQRLRKELDKLATFEPLSPEWVGIHPSWQNNNNAMNAFTTWRNEVGFLNESLGKATKHSRFHYIHLHLPQSYQLLKQLEIVSDWSMGYPDCVGFRAGTSIPFLWYDVSQEKQTNLKVVPFCIMDVTCKNYLKLNFHESIILGEQLKQKVQAVGGLFCFVFHNESVSESYPWKGWRKTILSWKNKN